MRQQAFKEDGEFYKGNLHTHTEVSDGKRPAAEIAGIYRDLGYDFLAVTDHNKLFKSDELNDEIYIIPALEIHSNSPVGDVTHHTVALTTYDNGNVTHGQVFENAAWTDSKEACNGIVDMMKPKGFDLIYCHSVWSRTEPEDFNNPALMGMEIYNGVCDVGWDQGYQEVHWDHLLRRGLKLWGMASDDSHGKDEHFGNAFVMVKSQKLDDHSLLQSLRDGAFYSSQGPLIYDFYVEGDRVEVKCSPAVKITFITYGHRGTSCRYNEPATEAYMDLTNEIDFVRVEVTDADGKKAWSNPIFLK